ncbi:MAG TPA: ATP-binding protein [Verrucomicrobiales bacterium]|nr:ATP-binding protein [Verrucomicrobiales bacterium]
MTDRREGGAVEVFSAFEQYERRVRVRNYRIAAVVGTVFMLLGSALDVFVYPEQVIPFLILRIACGLLLAVTFVLLWTVPGMRHHRAIGVVMAFIPLAGILWMIAATEGAHSPYYAGLNLVLIGAGLVLRWTFRDSAWVILATFAGYAAACVINQNLLGRDQGGGAAFNNAYFLFTTGVFVAAGTFAYNRLRLSEFKLRQQLEEQGLLLAEKNARLEEADRAKTRFFANISHELRTPLTLILAPLERLTQEWPRLERGQAEAMFATMEDNGLRLLKLINDLLDLVRVDSGQDRINPEPLDAAAYLRGIANSFEHLAQRKHVRLQVDTEPHRCWVMLDRDKLDKILLNLVQNALKFTPRGGRIALRSDWRDGLLEMAVEDSGVGIKAEDVEFVFDRFWQADSSETRKFQGAGIGLSLVKSLVEVQSGSITVESRPGQGAIFRVRLPAPAAPSTVESELDDRDPIAELHRRALFHARRSEPNAHFDLSPALEVDRRPLVLVADDEPDMRRFLRQHLGSYRVLEASDGEEAWQLARQFRPRVVVLDLMMPERTGLEVCQLIRQDPAARNLPVLILTARADEESKLQALQAGASDFLSKPFSSAELGTRVRNLLLNSQYQDELNRRTMELEQALEELRESQDRLVQAEKMASLGRMSAGLIHEVNNPMNYAKTALYLLREFEKNLGEEEREIFTETLADLEEGVNRVISIVSDLKTFTYDKRGNYELVDLGVAVETALRLTRHDCAGRGIRTENALRPRAGFETWGSLNQLVQVMVNLIENAMQALQAKHDFGGEDPCIRISAGQLEDRVFLRFRDNGTGIAAENLKRVFDPFFTTKRVGEGMGMGLTVSYNIVGQHGGKMLVESQEGVYTEFQLILARHAYAADATISEHESDVARSPLRRPAGG